MLSVYEKWTSNNKFNLFIEAIAHPAWELGMLIQRNKVHSITLEFLVNPQLCNYSHQS